MSTRIQQLSKFVVAAGLVGLCVVAGGCFRSPMRPSRGCSDADPTCQTGTTKTRDGGLDARDVREGDRSAGRTGGGGVGGTGSGGVGGAGGVRTGGIGGGVGGAGGVRTGGIGGGMGGAGGVRTGGSGGVRAGGTGGGSTGGARDGGVDRGTDPSGDARRDSPGDRSSDVVCGTREICDNGIDDDCNGQADCLDPACRSLPTCIDRKKETCNNGIDDDGNGFTDCKDPACFGDPACFVRGHEICNNGLDDDDDGLVDCSDPDCAKDPTCVVNPVKEICDNGIDDNKDGLVDCSDPQCKDFLACLSADCKADVDFGAIASSGASVTRTMSTVGATASYSTCAPPGGVGRVGSFSLAAVADVKLDFSQVKGSAHDVAVFRAGVGQRCDLGSNLVDCLLAGQKPTDSHTFNGLAAGNYWIVVQSFTGTVGSTTITLSTGKTTTVEICNNGIDDDGDGAIDCADLDCVNASNCRPCTADINLGAVVVGDSPKTTVVDTTKGSDRYHPSCAGKSTGKDIVVRFTVKDTVGLVLEMTQPTGDHAYGLYRMPKAGDACDSDDGNNCAHLSGPPVPEASWWPFDAGEYILIFKAMAAGKEGQVSLSVWAWAGRGVEICDNGIDDDNDNLVDCDDPDCANVISCQAPMCLPDSNLGDFDIGTRKTLNVDLTSATRTFTTFCGRGDGHGRAYRLNLLQPMFLGVHCTQTGSQVLQLAPQVNPLDPCDADNPSMNCVDLEKIPFGGDFTLPRLQPGVYNLLVQAFTSGMEGTVNLTLTGVSGNILEICNNGIDDDADGAIDCYDLKCAGDASCAKLVCQPDKALGILKLDGSPTAVAVQTLGEGDDQTMSPCVSGQGGADSVIGFTLTAKADLTIEWAQVGNHALVLYQQVNASMPCEANTRIDCKATANAAMGSYQLTGLAQGKYYLVVDADKAGSDSEGGVILQIKGFPSP